MACSYFDLAHCGYFESKDLEDILSTLSLNLSRAQLKKLVSKVVVSKDQVNYRLFTDKPVPVEGDEASEKVEETDAADPEEIGLGFKAFLPFKKGIKKDQEEGGEPTVTKDGICSYKGKTI